ncbi:MAG: hypothetical protein ACRCUY_05805, partial [Thermoguttaceae bacterium]
MKKMMTLVTLFLLVAASSLLAEPAKNAAPKPQDRAAAQKAFEQLTKNARKGLAAPNAVEKSKFVAIDPVDFTDLSGNQQKADSGMKIWFERQDGKFVDPTYYSFEPNERFFVHVEAAVPVYVVLYQNFPEAKESIQAYPVEKFPSSYRILEPGKGTKLPVLFKMDGNYLNEHMAVVVARADWDKIVQDV